jgi:hypothetical protein
MSGTTAGFGTTDGFFVPFGRRVYIKSGPNDVLAKYPDCYLINTEDFQISVDSSYGNLLETKGSNLLTLAANSLTLFGGAMPSGQFALQGVQIWEKTEPLSFSMELEIHAVNNAKEDVVNATKELMKITAPRIGATRFLGKTLIPPGPNLSAILEVAGITGGNSDTAGSKSLLGSIANALNLNNSQGVFNIVIGKYISITNVVIVKIAPTFSSIIDTNGYPTSAKLSIDFRTMEVATQEKIEEIFNMSTTNSPPPEKPKIEGHEVNGKIRSQ